MLDIWFMVADIILFSLLPFSVCYALSSWVKYCSGFTPLLLMLYGLNHYVGILMLYTLVDSRSYYSS